MAVVLYPSSTNWFYRRFAQRLAHDLRLCGLSAQDVSVAQMSTLDQNELLLIVNLAEVLFECRRSGSEQHGRRHISRFDRRILVNMDSIRTHWFERQLEEGAGLLTEIFDYGMIQQTNEDIFEGLPLTWIPEALCAADVRFVSETREKSTRRERRPVPWAIIGHETRGRSAFAAAAVQTLPPSGFVYLPPLRPFDGTYGLSEKLLHQVLAASDFYLWGSHHIHRYHECLRVRDAIVSGSVPVKIDPIHHAECDLPWVYSSLAAFGRSPSFSDPTESLRAATDRLLENGRLGENFANGLRRLDGPQTVPGLVHA